MLETKGEIEERINKLKAEISMAGYYDGWTLKGLKKEINILIEKLENINKKK